ncbi:hypothetical protein EVAR_71139_1 [Eumeta japonica]|uniref:Uncharacterized protein n=1 Tax=Eumeta variegata TaxID=151549 RepID=A0A4C2AFH0_EUMVA|nr:hypothetical protein EVAR_71139_1 [Eumeta japonica]
MPRPWFYVAKSDTQPADMRVAHLRTCTEAIVLEDNLIKFDVEGRMEIGIKIGPMIRSVSGTEITIEPDLDRNRKQESKHRAEKDSIGARIRTWIRIKTENQNIATRTENEIRNLFENVVKSEDRMRSIYNTIYYTI